MKGAPGRRSDPNGVVLEDWQSRLSLPLCAVVKTSIFLTPENSLRSAWHFLERARHELKVQTAVSEQVDFRKMTGNLRTVFQNQSEVRLVGTDL